MLSHGAGGCHLNWYQQIAELSRDRRVIAWDQRGFGLTEADGRSTSPSVAAGDLVAVLDECGVNKAWLVAQSMGGWGGSLCIREHPRRFAGFVLCDTVAGVVDDRVRARLDEFIEASAAAAASGVLFRSLAVDPDWPESERAMATGYQLAAQALPSTYAAAVTDIRDTTVGLDHLHELPVGVIVGANDQVFPPDLVRELLGGVADLGVHVIPGTGHSPYLENPQSFNMVLRTLLGSAA